MLKNKVTEHQCQPGQGRARQHAGGRNQIHVRQANFRSVRRCLDSSRDRKHGLVLFDATLPEREQYSGFLSNYNNLQQVTTTSGETAMRWVSPSWKPDAYDTVLFNRLELYPAPQPNDRVNR